MSEENSGNAESGFWDGQAKALAGGMATYGISLLGSYFSGKQQKKWAKYQAKQAKADARAALGAARLEAQKIREAAKTQQSQAVAAVAGSNVVVGDGSAALIEKNIKERAEQDAIMAIYDGQDAYKRQMAQAEAHKIKGQNAVSKSILGNVGSLFGFGHSAFLLGKKAYNTFFPNPNTTGANVTATGAGVGAAIGK